MKRDERTKKHQLDTNTADGRMQVGLQLHMFIPFLYQINLVGHTEYSNFKRKLLLWSKLKL